MHNGGTATDEKGADVVVEKMAHRDIKEANVLQQEGVVKVSDFGLVTGEDEKRGSTKGRTGTRTYLPPEAYSVQPRTLDVIQKGDVWAAGAAER